MSKAKDVSEPPIVDLSSSHPEPTKLRPVWGAEPSQDATKSTKILSTLKSGQRSKEHQTIVENESSSSIDVDMGYGGTLEAVVSTPNNTKMIILMASSRADDATGKHLRSARPPSHD
jgi:hypothetical protein